MKTFKNRVAFNHPHIICIYTSTYHHHSITCPLVSSTQTQYKVNWKCLKISLCFCSGIWIKYKTTTAVTQNYNNHHTGNSTLIIFWTFSTCLGYYVALKTGGGGGSVVVSWCFVVVVPESSSQSVQPHQRSNTQQHPVHSMRNLLWFVFSLAPFFIY